MLTYYLIFLGVCLSPNMIWHTMAVLNSFGYISLRLSRRIGWRIDWTRIACLFVLGQRARQVTKTVRCRWPLLHRLSTVVERNSQSFHSWNIDAGAANEWPQPSLLFGGSAVVASRTRKIDDRVWFDPTPSAQVTRRSGRVGLFVFGPTSPPLRLYPTAAYDDELRSVKIWLTTSCSAPSV